MTTRQNATTNDEKDGVGRGQCVGDGEMRRDAMRYDATTRPGLRGPSHPVYDRMADGWLVGRLVGWLAGLSVGRLGSQGPTHGYMCLSPVHAAACTRVLLVAPPPSPLFTLIPARVVSRGPRCPVFLLLFLSRARDERATAARTFFFFLLSGTTRATARVAVSNRLATGYGSFVRSFVRSYGGACETEEKKKRGTRERGKASRSATKRFTGKSARGRERERRKREKGRIGWGGAFQSRSEPPRVPTTIEKGETCRRGYRRGQ